MSKKLVLILTATLILSVIFIFFLNKDNSQPPQPINQTDNIGSQQANPNLATDPKMSNGQNSSGYIEHSSGVLENISTSNKTVLFFYASWCPTCRPVNEELLSSELPSDLTIIRVNYNDPDTDDEERGLAQKYGVTYQHTFVQIDSSGNELSKWNGGGLQNLLEKLQ